MIYSEFLHEILKNTTTVLIHRPLNGVKKKKGGASTLFEFVFSVCPARRNALIATNAFGILTIAALRSSLGQSLLANDDFFLVFSIFNFFFFIFIKTCVFNRSDRGTRNAFGGQVKMKELATRGETYECKSPQEI